MAFTPTHFACGVGVRVARGRRVFYLRDADVLYGETYCVFTVVDTLPPPPPPPTLPPPFPHYYRYYSPCR